jgi:hypothetical protein
MNTFLKLFSLKLSLLLIVSFIGFTLIGQNETTKSEFISFYRYIPEKMTWNEHKKLAAIMGGDLACITNATENEQVRRIAGGEIVWVGGIRKGCGNGPGPDHWKWSNGKDWSYTNWRAGEPNNSPSSHDPYSEYDENRVMLWENGEWNDASLLHEFSAIYEIPSSSLVTYDTKDNASIPLGLTVSGAGSPEVNGTYVFVKNKHKNRIFSTEAGHYQHTNNPSIFIAFQNCGRLLNKSEWNKWVIFTDKGARYAAHTNRKINVPPRFGEWETVDHWPSGVEEAGKHPAPSIHYDNKEHKRVSNYISANDISDDTPTEQNETNNQPLSYYKFIPEKMTWAEHNNQAISMGGNLATISNAIEDNKVKEVSNGVNVWLGGVRKGCGNDTGADHWYWSNGEKWFYTNWMKNQPDNYQKSENRVHMTPISHGQQWNDISEDHQFSAVYELPLNDSVEYFEDNEIENLDLTEMKKNPIRKILGSLIFIGSILQIQKINLNQKK